MHKLILVLFTFYFYSSLTANEKNKVEITQESQSGIFQSKLECQSKINTGSFQNCWLILSHKEQTIQNADIYLNGGMPEHEHGLPTTPKVTWSKDKNAYLIKGLKFSMPGQWKLNFKVNNDNEALTDKIIMSIVVY